MGSSNAADVSERGVETEFLRGSVFTVGSSVGTSTTSDCSSGAIILGVLAEEALVETLERLSLAVLSFILLITFTSSVLDIGSENRIVTSGCFDFLSSD